MVLSLRLSDAQVQKTRVAVVKAYNEAAQEAKLSILKDAVIIHLHSVTPPDRVGCVIGPAAPVQGNTAQSPPPMCAA